MHKYARAEDRPEKTLFIITTDGMENAGREYSYDRVRHLIEKEKEKYGWEFIFLGANMDAIQVASRFGIAADRAASFECDSEGTVLNYKVIEATIAKARKSGSASEMRAAMDESDELAEVRRDYSRRHRR